MHVNIYTIVMQITRKKLVFIIISTVIGIIVLLSMIYQKTALWKPEQSLVTLLPESPICYMTLKELDGLVKTFNQSELGKEAARMPILSDIKDQLWWKQLVYQKAVWEHEMGGKLDMGAVKGHFGTEAILALYQREGELSFLLITEVGGTEKLGIDALTATDAINPNYKRIQSEYNGLTINTITGFPLEFSYTFIGKIGILSLNPLLLADVIDIYSGSKDGFLVQHPIKDKIEESYEQDSNTGYLDIPQLSTLLNSSDNSAVLTAKGIFSLFPKTVHCTFGNRYTAGSVISRTRFGNPETFVTSNSVNANRTDILPMKTASIIHYPKHDWSKLWKIGKQLLSIEVEADKLELSKHLDDEMTLALVSHSEEESIKFPSIVLHALIQNKTPFVDSLAELNGTNITVGGNTLEFLETQDYQGVIVQPIRLRFNFLLSITAGYATIDNHFFFSTTLDGLKSVVDTILGDAPALSNITFSSDENVTNAFIQPRLLIPEVRRFLPIASIFLSLSGQKVDVKLMQQIKDNLFPLESLGPITGYVYSTEKGIESEFRITLNE